jgi:predicted secreted protein
MPTSTPIPGYQGKFKVGAVAMIQVQSIELQANGETYDITIMSGLSTPQWKAFLAGLLSWTLKVVGFYDFTNDAVQNTLWTGFGTQQAISWSPNTGTNNFSGNAIITNIPVKDAVNAVTSVEFDFQGSGALTYA